MQALAQTGSTTTALQPGRRFPGTTAPGIGSASQLLDWTGSFVPRGDATAAPRGLILLAVVPSDIHEATPFLSPLRAGDYPILAGIWDNDADNVFDAI